MTTSRAGLRLSRDKQQATKPTIELVLRRVEALLRQIRQESNHGEVSIEVIAGRYYVAGGPRTEYIDRS